MNKSLLLLLFIYMSALVGCGGAESRMNKYLESGHAFYLADDCKKAKLDYKNALQINPKNVDGQIGLAKCLLDDKEWEKAYQILNGALQEDPNSVEAKVALAKIYLIAGESDKAYELIESALVINPENSSAVALRGVFHLRNNTLSAARTDAKNSLALEKNNTSGLILMTALQVKDQKNEEAISDLENILSDESIDQRKRKELQVLLLSLYSQSGDTENIISIYEALIEQYPAELKYTYGLVSVYSNDGQLDKAEDILLSLIEDDSDNHEYIILYISFLDKYKSSEEATEKLEEFISTTERNGKLKISLGKRYLDLNEIDKARNIFTSLASDPSAVESNEAKNELAFLLLKDGEIDAAYDSVQEVLTEQPTNVRALILRGTIALSRRDAPQAIADFRTILRDQPRNILIIRQLSAAYILNGQEDLAKELIAKAVEIDGSNKEIGLMHARLQGSDKEYESAIDTVNELLVKNEGDLETIKTLFDLQIANQDYSGAKQTAESMKSSLEENPLGYYLSGVLLQNENKLDEAELEYKKALEKEPRANEPLSGLIRLYVTQEKFDTALKFLNEITKKDPEYLVPYNLRGEIGLTTKNYQLAKDNFESAIQHNNKWWIPYRGLSLVYAAQNQIDKSIDVLKQGFDNGANPERLGLELAVIVYGLGRRDEAIEIYERILKAAPNSLVAKNNIAMLLVDEKSTKEDVNRALEYVSDIEDIEEAASLDTVGWVNYKAGNTSRAIEFLSRAVKLAPNAAELHYHLGMAYADQQGSLSKAKEHLKIAIQLEQEFTGKDIAIEKLEEL